MKIDEAIEIGKSTLSLEKGDVVEINREALRLLVEASKYDPSVRYVKIDNFKQAIKNEPSPGSGMGWINWLRNNSKASINLVHANNLRMARLSGNLSDSELQIFFGE
jgi:hypothetical protein